MRLMRQLLARAMVVGGAVSCNDRTPGSVPDTAFVPQVREARDGRADAPARVPRAIPIDAEEPLSPSDSAAWRLWIQTGAVGNELSRLQRRWHLPESLSLKLAHCYEWEPLTTAFYLQRTGEVVICYEYLAELAERLENVSPPESLAAELVRVEDEPSADSIVSPGGDSSAHERPNLIADPALRRLPGDEGTRAAHVAYRTRVLRGLMRTLVGHEVAHALAAEYRLPITGREEDFADQFALMELLDDPQASDGELHAPFWHFAAISSDETSSPDGEHPPDLARMYNVVCWLVGSDAARFDALRFLTGLSNRRAAGCAEETMRWRRSIHAIMAPYRTYAELRRRP